MGIGTSSPASKLDVSGTAGITSFTGTTALGSTIRGATSSNDYSGLDFRSAGASSGSVPIARIGAVAAGSGSSLNFGTSNSYGSGITNTAMSINPSGNTQFLATIGVGNTTPSTSGAGISFPATQSASSDANTLDDYEEGTWTPAGSTGFPAGGAPSSITATYTKIGNMVSVRAQFSGYNDGTSLLISGLPFTVSGDASCSVSNSTRSFTFQRVSGTGIYCTASGTDSSTQYWFISTTYRTT